MNVKVLAAIILFCLTVAGCVVCIFFMVRSNETNSDTEPTLDIEGVVLEIKENSVSNTGLTLIMKNMAQNEYLYGDYCVIENQADGECCQLPFIRENIGLPAITYTLEGYGVKEIDLNWTWYYGELTPGDYRIIKDFNLVVGDVVYGAYEVSADFTID